MARATPGAGRMTGGTIQIAVQAILSGMLDTVAVVYGNDGRSAGARYGVQVTTGATLTKLTGETFDLSTKVTVVGTPSSDDLAECTELGAAMAAGLMV